MSTSHSLLDLPVPTDGRSVGHYFAWLSTFLFGVLAFTGILLSTLYVPSTAPASVDDGTPLGLGVVTDTVRWLGRDLAGLHITFPLDLAGDSLIVPVALSGRVLAVRDSATSRVVRPSAAWTSVEETIQIQADLGWLVRGIHRGAVHLLVAAVLLHLLTALVTGGWRRPRRGTWLGGLALLVLVMAFAFSGSVLPWSRLSFVAARISAGFWSDALPWLGPAVAGIVRGGSDVGQSTLTRFHALHTIALPLLTVTLLLGHLARVRRHGIGTAPASRPTNARVLVPTVLSISAAVGLALLPLLQSRFEPWSPAFVFALVLFAASVSALIGATVEPRNSVGVPLRAVLYRDFIAWLLLAGALVTIVRLAPHTLGAADGPVDMTSAMTTPDNVHPEWYLGWAFELVGAVPAPAALVVMLAALVALGAIGSGRTGDFGEEEDKD